SGRGGRVRPNRASGSRSSRPSRAILRRRTGGALPWSWPRNYSTSVANAYIVDAVRSPIGRKNGTLSKIRGDELAGQVLNALVTRSDLDPAEVEDVQLGCVTQIGEQGWNIGRMVPLVAGWPETVGGTGGDRQ